MAEQQQQQQQRAPDVVVRGVVAASNSRGIKLEGQDAWLDVSQYSDINPATLPQRGETVEVRVRGGTWLRAIKVLTPGDLDELEGEAVPDFGEAPGPDDDPGRWGHDGPGRGTAAPRAVPSARLVPPAPVKPTGRATLKAAALAAAAHFHSGRAGEEGAEGDVYATAYRFLAFLEADD